MIRAIWFILLLIIASIFAAFISERPGIATLTWLGFQVETSIGLLFALVLLFSIILAICFRAYALAKSTPEKIITARQNWRQRRGYKALTQGMVAVAAGDAIEARRLSKKAETLLADPPLTMLLSAQAAQLSGDEKAASSFFDAMAKRPETKYLGISGKLKQAIQEGNTNVAIELAEEASSLKPKTSAITETLLDLQIKKGDWKNAGETVKKSIKLKSIEPNIGHRKRAILLYQQSIEDEEDGKLDNALNNAKKSNSLAPDFIPSAVRTARLLQTAGKRRKAAAIIEEAWVLSPHPYLVEVMKDLAPGGGPQEIMRTLENLANYNKSHLESHIAVAKSALAAGMLLEAREHLEAVSDDNPSSRVCRYMAELLEEEGKSSNEINSWLRRAAMADPDSAWVCDNCGHAAAGWVVTCKSCEEFDSLLWKTPPRVSQIVMDEDQESN